MLEPLKPTTKGAPFDLRLRNEIVGRLQTRRGLTRSQVSRVHRLYISKGLTLEELSAALGGAISSWSNRFARFNLPVHSSSHRRNGFVPPRKVALRRSNAFDQIDSDDAAYWLGFCLADLKVRPDGFDLTLARKDREQLVHFKRWLGTEAPILDCYSTLGAKKYPNSSLIVYSAHLRDALARLGVVAGRVKRNTPLPKVPKLFQVAFWRGLFDGDGWIQPASRNPESLAWIVGFTGTQSYVKAFITFLKSNGVHPLTFHGNGGVVVKTQIQGYRAVLTLRLLYSSKGPALPRKRDVADSVLKAYAAAFPMSLRSAFRKCTKRGFLRYVPRTRLRVTSPTVAHQARAASAAYWSTRRY